MNDPGGIIHLSFIKEWKEAKTLVQYHFNNLLPSPAYHNIFTIIEEDRFRIHIVKSFYKIPAHQVFIVYPYKDIFGQPALAPLQHFC